jgi:hypothetical protein
MLAGVPGEKPCRPQFVQIAKLRCLPASQRCQPSLGFDGDRRCLAGARPIVQRSHRAVHDSSLNTTLHCLMMQSERLLDCKKRRVLPISQHNPRSIYPARWFGSRLCYRPHLSTSELQFDRSPPRCHFVQPFAFKPPARYKK